ncbi:hypothetical protein FGLOB1_9714 [Fusarium globosum]|uniref:DNA/RNA-binding domain-containing protein n=1 Tax=Fusarium globosum TaxID=78864 RepID=A0A8H6D3H5_9HYPO|nr:hypothetical protein FGLOB1_9714 [Fusarium globosum]
MAKASDSEARRAYSRDDKPLYSPKRRSLPSPSLNKRKRETGYGHQKTPGSEIGQGRPAKCRPCSPTPDPRASEVAMRLPEARSIPREWLIAEARGIYAGLVRVEAKCIEVDHAQLSNTHASSRLNDEQWQILIELHRTLLHEHHDFFLVIQHPSATPDMSKVASQYSMPGRLWRHGIHSFLELLRQRLPDSLEHMLTFLHSAYGMMTLLHETVLDFQDTWTECLGDLCRYRMAIEDQDSSEREIWRGVSRRWYSMASDKSPTTGRLYHHHAILARPNTLQQLCYYVKSLCVSIPFSSARESMMVLFYPVLSSCPSRGTSFDAAFVRVHGKAAVAGNRASYRFKDYPVHTNLHRYYIAISLSCSLLGYGSQSNVLMRTISNRPEGTDAAVDSRMTQESIPDDSFKLALDFARRTITVVIKLPSYNSILPFVYSILVFMNHMTKYPVAMSHLGNLYPWKETANMLNVLLLSCNNGHYCQSHFRLPRQDQVLHPLPEDFIMRGLPYSADHFPDRWFRNSNIDEDERNLELPSQSEERKVRILSLGWRIATLNEWLIWDEDTHLFYASKSHSTRAQTGVPITSSIQS